MENPGSARGPRRTLPRIRMMWGSWRQLHEPATTPEAPPPAPSRSGVLVGFLFLLFLAGAGAVVVVRGRAAFHSVGRVEVTPVAMPVSSGQRPLPALSLERPRESPVQSTSSAAVVASASGTA